jgi:alpha-ribazole phosphatase/probable phosphoglycerate mutase
VTTLVDLIRHGEPVGGSRYRGQLDDPLSEKGWAQMRAAVEGRDDWQQIVTSPLSRCAAFAQELSARLMLPIETESRFMEIGFGSWEGRTRDELRAQDPLLLQRFQRAPLAHPVPGAEPVDQFRARVAAAWHEMVARHSGRHVLVVAHAGVIRAVVSEVLGIPPENMFRIRVDNAALTRVKVDPLEDGHWQTLVFHGGRT